MIIKTIFTLISKLLYESGTYSIYSYPRQQNTTLPVNSTIETIKRFSDVPSNIRRHILKFRLINPLYYRLKSGAATLLIIRNDTDLIAYGLTQDWKPFKKKFNPIVKSDAIMLGPYWTNPKFRGKGYYGELLRKSINLVDQQAPIIIYANQLNINSRKGIEKQGFKFLGSYKIIFLLRNFNFISKINDDEILN